jgi:exodeoxyribonuclease-3
MGGEEAIMSWKVATFNINGIRARLDLVLDWLSRRGPDVLCLQEIKCQNDQFPMSPFRELGYFASVRGQKAYHGVAILARSQPEEGILGFGDGEPDEEARLIAAKLAGVWVVNTYVPQGRDPGDPAFQSKLRFFSRLKQWFEAHHDAKGPLVWVGDLNVAPEGTDVFDPKRMDGKIGFHPDERSSLADVISWGFTDLYRLHHPEKRQFTFWDYRLPKSFERNLGWRIDHILVTEPMARLSLRCEVDEEPRGLEGPSDHTPVWAEFDLGR